MNPLSGFYAAITRKSPKGESPHGPGGWFPEQLLTRQEALRGMINIYLFLSCICNLANRCYPGMTIDAAYASFTESTLGSIEVGKRADFTILSRDIMSIPVEEILGTQVHATIIDGMAVYGHV
jgi:predicted amidohydrolase YtcJ